MIELTGLDQWDWLALTSIGLGVALGYRLLWLSVRRKWNVRKRLDNCGTTQQERSHAKALDELRLKWPRTHR